MWNVKVSKKFEKKLSKLDAGLASKIERFVIDLEVGFYPEGYDIKKLRDKENEYRCRIGKYRVIYVVYKKEITIILIDVDHRKDIYK